jgi:hypothetical protein
LSIVELVDLIEVGFVGQFDLVESELVLVLVLESVLVVVLVLAGLELELEFVGERFDY